MRRVSLDTGHLTDEELGISGDLDKSMRDKPAPKCERVVLTRNGNFVAPRRS